MFSKDTKSRVSLAIALGYDLSSNRSQGYKLATYEPLLDEIDISYKIYDKFYIQNNKVTLHNNNKWGVNIHPYFVIRNHYNAQSKKNKNRKILYIKDYIEDNLNKQLWKLNKVCAFSRHERSNVIAIDIDCHKESDKQKSLDAFKFIVKNYYKNIKYSEISINNGFHIFIEVNEIPNQSQLKQFQNYLHSLGYDNIDIIGANNKNQILQFIDSPSYLPIKIFKDGSFTGISENDYSYNVLFFDLKSKLKTVNDLMIDYKKEELIIPIFANRKFSNKSSSLSKEEIIIKLKNKYNYSSGQRIEYMKKIASACLYYNLNKYEYLDIILANNKGSKDLSKWTTKQIENIYFTYYDKFCTIYTKNKSNFIYHSKDIFYSNSNLITNPYMKVQINKFSNTLINKVILPNLKYNKWINEYKRITPLLINEIIGTLLYDKNNPKQKNPLSKLTNNKFKQITSGLQISNKQLELFKKNYNCKINIQKLCNLILQDTIFKQIMINNLGYCYNKQYSFNRVFKLNTIIININKSIIINIQNWLSNYTYNIKYIMSKVCIKEIGSRESLITEFANNFDSC